MTHHYTTHNPMSEARRYYVHGPLVRPEGQLGIRAGASFLITLFLVATLFVVAFGS